jgi:hypothetical protein
VKDKDVDVVETVVIEEAVDVVIFTYWLLVTDRYCRLV